MKKTRKDFIHEAKLKGELTYHTGTACKRGHVADRYVSTGHCTVCSKENRDKNYASNKETYLTRAKSNYEADPQSAIDKVTRRYVRNRFDLSLEEYDAKFKEHRGRCDICNKPLFERTTGRAGNLDHDHSTGKVRGILCTNCNTGLGAFKDDPDLLLKAKSYLALYVS